MFGSYDENLKHLETIFNVRTRTSGHEVIVEGDVADVARAERVLDQLASLLRGGYKLAKGDVRTAAQLVAQDDQVELADYFLRGAPRASGKRQVLPKSVNQRKYLDAIDKYDIVFGIGPAGTGKTYLAMAQAVTYLLSKRISRIILARPAVEAGEKLGFLPGDLQDKVDPYLRPLYDALFDLIDYERVTRLLEKRVRNIFICSLVVFCASSRMMNASDNVRPRMKASGATSISLRSLRRSTSCAPRHSFSASQIGSM